MLVLAISAHRRLGHRGTKVSARAMEPAVEHERKGKRGLELYHVSPAF